MKIAASQHKDGAMALALGVLALLLLALCIWNISRFSEGLTIVHDNVDGIPATIFRPVSAPRGPVVVVAHGFAGSQQMMQPIAETLARNGFVVVTFDFAGHGRNLGFLSGGLRNLGASTKRLIADLTRIATYARALPDSDGRLALVGHSMASELVVQYAMQNRGVDAVVALSLFGQAVTAENPRNLLVIDGAWEPQVLRDAARRIVAEVAGAEAEERKTYGDFRKGDARRFVYAAGAEHIGVIYSHDALEATRDWLNGAFGPEAPRRIVDGRGPWLGAMCLALVALLRAATEALPRLAPELPPARRALRLAGILGVAAFLTPVALAQLPTDFLPILLGDYLAAHFALYGALLWAGLWVTREPRGDEFGWPWWPVPVAGLIAGAGMIALFGLPLDAYVTSFLPTGLRLLLIPAEFAAVLAAFSAEERLARGKGAPRFAYVGCKIAFLASLALAIALSPERLFFLIIITPVIGVVFILFGFFNHWCWTRTQAPLVGAVACSLMLAWAIVSTFPLVG